MWTLPNKICQNFHLEIWACFCGHKFLDQILGLQWPHTIPGQKFYIITSRNYYHHFLANLWTLRTIDTLFEESNSSSFSVIDAWSGLKRSKWTWIQQNFVVSRISRTNEAVICRMLIVRVTLQLPWAPSEEYSFLGWSGFGGSLRFIQFGERGCLRRRLQNYTCKTRSAFTQYYWAQFFTPP